MTHTTGQGSGYSLDPAYALERERLDLLAESTDGWSKNNLERVGVAAGWRCLEVGAGTGSIAMWLSDRVAPDGRCVAIDIDTRYLDSARDRGVEVLERDVRTADLPDESFDLIHVRAVVTHLDEPERVISRMTQWLRPGGRLVVEEPDGLLARHGEDPAWRRLWASVTGYSGFDVDCGRSLPRKFSDAGLVDVDAVGWAPLIRPGTALAMWNRMSFNAFGPAAISGGVLAQADFDAAAARLDQPDFLEFGVLWVSCSGRRPV